MARTFTRSAAPRGLVALTCALALGCGPSTSGDPRADASAPPLPAPLGFVPRQFFPAHRHTVPDGVSDHDWAYYQQGGGLALGDFDGDGHDDLFVSGGEQGHQLFRRGVTGAFVVDVAALPSLSGFVSSATFADVDGDGDLDLLLSHLLAPRGLTLLRNVGGVFSDVTDEAGLGSFAPTAAWSTTFADIDGDGDLDLFVAQWLHNTTPAPVNSPHMFCNDGAGAFEDCSDRAGMTDHFLSHVDSSFTGTFSDLDEDFRPDLLLAADYRRSTAFRGDGDGGFAVLPTSSFIVADFGMGSVVADFDGDLHMDWFVTAIDLPAELGNASGNRLMLGDGRGNLRDVTEIAGVAAGGWGWAACAADFDLDGDVDLFHVNGYEERPALELTAFARTDRSRLYLNDGAAHFDEVAAAMGVDDPALLTATLCADFDDDGDIDIVTMGPGGALRAYENTLGGGRYYATFDLAGTHDNVHGVGAWVEVRSRDLVQVRERRIDNTHASGQTMRLHVGLPSDAPVDVIVRWPNGTTSEHPRLAANHRHRLQQP